jgi:hypothetical protein
VQYLSRKHVSGIVLNRPVGLDVSYSLLLSGEGRRGETKGRIRKGRKKIERGHEKQEERGAVKRLTRIEGTSQSSSCHVMFTQ